MHAELGKKKKKKTNHEFKDSIWLTDDQRVDRNEKWFNIMIKQ